MLFFLGGGALLRALRVRVGACLAVVQCLDEMTRFWLPNVLVDGVM